MDHRSFDLSPFATAVRVRFTPATSIAFLRDLPDPDAGIIAMGHSGITGEGSTDDSTTWKDYSWATGSADDVNSIYARIVEVYPETKGKVANTGAPRRSCPARQQKRLNGG